jgi:plasmid stabilization system protein ParE
LRIELTDGAESDLENALDWSDQFGAKHRLGRALEAGIGRIAESPLRWREIEPGVRRLVIRKFPYSIVYARHPEQDYLVILAFAHHKREPGYWRERK